MSNNDRIGSAIYLGLFGLFIQAVLITLKLVGIIAMDWQYILLPIIFIGVYVVLIMVAFVVAAIIYMMLGA